MILLNEVTLKHPVLRINNRGHNIKFYKRLGSKLVSEENTIARFSTKQKNARFVIEKSPAPDTHVVEGARKVNKIVVEIPNADEVTVILGNGVAVGHLFKGKDGYTFETLSLEGDLSSLHSEDDTQQLTEIDSVNLPKDDELEEVSNFSFGSMTFNVADGAAAHTFYDDVFEGQFLSDIQFVQTQGVDLAVDPPETWDVEILEYQVPDNYDLKALASFLESKEQAVYLDKKASVLVLPDPNSTEAWSAK